MNSRIYLIGFMGSGKSTLCSTLARQIGYDCVDMDHLIEETSGMRIPEIFREHGEKVFRKWERDILLELMQREKVVVSTGGGAPCHDDMIALMNQSGTTLYIQMPPPALLSRLMKSRTERPMLQGKTNEELLEHIETLLEERESYYLQAHLKIDGRYLNLDSLVNILRNS